MPYRPESVVRLPLLDEAAQALKERGSYQRELTSQELAVIVAGVVRALTQGQESVIVTVPAMDVRIESAQGLVHGTVRVDKPITATIIISFALNNDSAPSRIKLAGLDMKQEASFTAKLALKAVNIEGKTREALQDPNRALELALASQLEARGARLTGLGLHFNKTTLSVDLKGEPAGPRI